MPLWERLKAGRGAGTWRREHAGGEGGRGGLGSAAVRGVSTSRGWEGLSTPPGGARSAQGPATPLGQARPAGRALLSLAPAAGPQKPRLLWGMPLGPDVTCESDSHRAPLTGPLIDNT